MFMPLVHHTVVDGPLMEISRLFYDALWCRSLGIHQMELLNSNAALRLRECISSESELCWIHLSLGCLVCSGFELLLITSEPVTNFAKRLRLL